MAGKKSKKSKKNKKNTKHKPGGSSASEVAELRRVLCYSIEKLMDDLSEFYGDSEIRKQALRECAAAIEAYAEYVKAATGDQYMFNSQSKCSSETVEVTFVDESMVSAESGDLQTFESGDLQTFPYLFEEFLDKLHEMAQLLPVSKTDKAKAKEDDINGKERTTVIKSDSDHAKGRATGEKVGAFAFKNTDEEEKSEEDLVGLEEQLMEMRYRSLHQNNRYISSIMEE